MKFEEHKTIFDRGAPALLGQKLSYVLQISRRELTKYVRKHIKITIHFWFRSLLRNGYKKLILDNASFVGRTFNGKAGLPIESAAHEGGVVQNKLLVAVTEKRTEPEMDRYLDVFSNVLGELST